MGAVLDLRALVKIAGGIIENAVKDFSPDTNITSLNY
jgi:hypothetical protein